MTAAAKSRVAAGAVLAGPGVLVLLVLSAGGALDWRYAAVGAAVLLAAAGLWLRHHLRRIEALRQAVEALSRDEQDQAGADEGLADPLLCPGLGTAVTRVRRRRQARYRQLSALLTGNEAILSSLPDPLIMLDGARRIVRANPAATEVLGDGLPGRDLTAVLRSPALLEATDAVLGGEATRTTEFSVPGRLEFYFKANVAGLPEPAPDGTVAILSLHDLTGVKRAEQLRGDFVANASHELRTPLASLLGFIETLRGAARDDESARARFLALMNEQATRMSRLVDDLLSLSRIELQEHTPPSGFTNLGQLLKSVAGTLEIHAGDKDMRIDVACEDLAPVPGNHDELTQLFQNLIDNAVKYGRAGTVVQVEAARSRSAERRVGRQAVAIAIRDEGEGIPREHLPRLTERFYRVDTARSRELGGTGLGLAIVKHIVNRHRGALEIDSRVGEGSTFTVYLPIAARDTGDAAAE